MSLTFAVLAGALAMLNPCSFALLPAFLSLYLCTEDTIRASSTRTLRAILVGLTITAGALSIFTLVGVPVALGAGQLTRAVPWVGVALGLVLAVVAVLTLAGKRIPLPDRGLRTNHHHRRRGWGGLLLFGAGYGIASLSCTLPIFLVVVGASLTTTGGLAALVVFAGYAAGMAVVLTALAIGAGLLRERIARTLTSVLPRLRWLTGGLLALTSAYLLYYWGTALFTPARTRAHDPLVSLMERMSATIQSWATHSAGTWLLLTAAAIVAAALLRVLWRWARTDPHHNETTEPDTGTDTGTEAETVDRLRSRS
jgi:cytochrome c biogenesis protein CcdA